MPVRDYSPPVTIPPDTVSLMDVYTSVPRLWHWPTLLAEAVGKIATGRGVKIAVLDTGYTPHVNGPTVFASESFVRGESTSDPHGHGTHCIGTAMGRGGIGVAPDAELLVGKVLSNSGSGSSDGIARGVRWAVDAGANVISMSLGGGSSYKPTNDAIDYAFSKGVIVNVAAGNSGFNGGNTIGWPAKHLGSLCCGAYRSDGRIASFSSGGREMDWACPGEAIISFSNDGRSYTTKSGTSMATPFGSGVIALLLEIAWRQGDKQWTSVEAVRQFFAGNLKDGGAPGDDPLFGKGFPVVDTFIAGLLNKTLTWF